MHPKFNIRVKYSSIGTLLVGMVFWSFYGNSSWNYFSFWGKVVSFWKG